MARSLALMVFLCLAISRSQSAGATPQPAPRKQAETSSPVLIVAGEDTRLDSEGVLLPRDAVRRIGSGLFRHDLSACTDVAFSPSGDTVYLASWHRLIAIDAVTGRRRFEYDNGVWNFRVTKVDGEGIRVDFLQGPNQGSFVVLEHGTGKELRRGQRLTSEQHADDTIRSFGNERRAFVVRRIQRNPLEGPSRDDDVFLWDLENDQELALLGRTRDLDEAITVSPDHRLIAFVDNDRVLSIVETESGNVLRKLPADVNRGERGNILPTWSGDGRKVYQWRFAGQQWQIAEIDAQDGEPRIVASHKTPPTCPPVVSPDARHLAYAAGEDAIWRVVDLSSLEVHREIDRRPALPERRAVNGDPANAIFSPDGDSLWFVSECALSRYDLAAGEFASPRGEPFLPVEALSFSADGRQLHGVAGAELITWDVASGIESLPRKGFGEFARDEPFARCISIDDMARESVWKPSALDLIRVVDGQIAATFNAGDHPQSCCISSDGRWIVHEGEAGGVFVSDFQTGEVLHELYPVERPRPTYFMTLAPDNRTLAVGHWYEGYLHQVAERTIELWDLATREKLRDVSLLADPKFQMVFTPNSQQLRVWHRAKTGRRIATFDVTDGAKVGDLMTSMNTFPARIPSSKGEWFLDGRNLIDMEGNRVVRTWDCSSSYPHVLALSPDESLLAIACPDGPVLLLDFKSAAE